jgi:hypothetical protein
MRAVDGCGLHADHDFARSCLWVRSVAVDEFLWAPWLGDIYGLHVVELPLSLRCSTFPLQPCRGTVSSMTLSWRSSRSCVPCAHQRLARWLC